MRQGTPSFGIYGRAPSRAPQPAGSGGDREAATCLEGAVGHSSARPPESPNSNSSQAVPGEHFEETPRRKTWLRNARNRPALSCLPPGARPAASHLQDPASPFHTPKRCCL